ncbi:MAG: YjgP/YjgQ family permease [Bacteroidales bacterium]|nr:YjgP/YjgQ family permease [Bacteroidales bacterium]
MKIIDWYIFKKFLGTFVYAISLLIIIVIIFDISENIEDYLKSNAPIKAIVFDYYINFIPYFINLYVYLFTFISVIFFTSKMAGNTEIVAILSSGVSFIRLLRPYLMAALFLGAVSLYLGNFLIPRTDQVRRDFKNKYMGKLADDKGKNIHIQIEKGVFVYVESFNNKVNTGYKFTLERFENQQMTYKLSSERIEFDSIFHKWRIVNYLERQIDSLHETIVKGKEKDTTLNLLPTDLYKISQDFEVMNFWELRHHIESEHLKGSASVVKYEVEMHKRLASPVAIIVLTFIGVALSSRKVRGGIGMHLGLGIGITFSYILFMQFSTVFATYGNLHPAFAAWLPNIIFAILGVYLILKAPK